jgi:phosphopantothenoylcysteine decarboxylase/phosphopantothenate--cysteine ligase
VLITAGPTREFIDPVRFISNASSGKMGAALARAARRTAAVIVVSGPVEIKFPADVRQVAVVSAEEMFRKVKEYLPKVDIFISAAAVADYRPKKRYSHKLKKEARSLTIELVPTRDILAWAGRQKGRCVLVGFALESKALLSAARVKRKRKNLDFIVANAPDAIGRDRSRYWLIDRIDHVRALPMTDKSEVAEIIINEALRIWQDRQED